MNGYCTVLVCVALCLSGCGPSHPADEVSRADAGAVSVVAAVADTMSALVAAGEVAGVVFGLQQGEAPPQIVSAGSARLADAAPMEVATRFPIASLTKPFTALAVARLVEEGAIRLDDPIDRFFEGFPDGERITVAHLLSHTSGIPDWWMGGLPVGAPEDWTYSGSPHRYLMQMERTSLFESGTQYAYSNSGYLLLGEIVERISGRSFGAYLEETMMAPLGMRATRLAGEGAAMTGTALGYTRSAADSTQAGLAPVDFSSHLLHAAGGLESTAEDLLAWSEALFDGRIIGHALVDRMTAYATVTDGRPVYEAVYVPEGMTAPAWPDHMRRNGYGLGVSRSEMYGQTVIWHSGGMPGFNAIWAHLPDLDATIVVLSNTENGAVPVFEQAVRLLTRP